MIWDEGSVKLATSCEITGKFQAGSLCIDSRVAKEGELFVAIKGEKADGHDYVSGILDKVSVAIVERIPRGCEDRKDKLILVENSLQAIKDLASYNRARTKAKIIAVTGSVGKTSTKEQLKLAFEGLGKIYCSAGNYNSQISCPLSIASMPIDTEYGIFELGMSYPGEMSILSEIVRPHLSIITNIAPCHAENFDSVGDIARAKAEIFLGMEKGGVAILNADSEYYNILEEEAKKSGIEKIKTFGEKDSWDSTMKECKRVGSASEIDAKILSEDIHYKMIANGKHHAINSVAVLTAVSIMELDLKKAASGLERFGSIKGRGKVSALSFYGKEIELIDESYNASPISVKAALSVLGSETSKRRIAVLADMYELGDIAEDAHKELSYDVMRNLDKVITVGPLMKGLYDKLPDDKTLAHFENYEQVMRAIPELVDNGDCVLVKGSLGTKISELVKFMEGSEG